MFKKEKKHFITNIILRIRKRIPKEPWVLILKEQYSYYFYFTQRRLYSFVTFSQIYTKEDIFHHLFYIITVWWIKYNGNEWVRFVATFKMATYKTQKKEKMTQSFNTYFVGLSWFSVFIFVFRSRKSFIINNARAKLLTLIFKFS